MNNQKETKYYEPDVMQIFRKYDIYNCDLSYFKGSLEDLKNLNLENISCVIISGSKPNSKYVQVAPIISFTDEINHYNLYEAMEYNQKYCPYLVPFMIDKNGTFAFIHMKHILTIPYKNVLHHASSITNPTVHKNINNILAMQFTKDELQEINYGFIDLLPYKIPHIPTSEITNKVNNENQEIQNDNHKIIENDNIPDNVSKENTGLNIAKELDKTINNIKDTSPEEESLDNNFEDVVTEDAKENDNIQEISKTKESKNISKKRRKRHDKMPSQFPELYLQWRAGNMNVTQISKLLNRSYNMTRRHLHNFESLYPEYKDYLQNLNY